MKSYDHVWPNIHEKGRLDNGGASEYRVCGWLQPRDNASTHVWTEPHSWNTHTRAIVFANGQSASHTQPLSFAPSFHTDHNVSSSFIFYCPVPKPLTTAVMCPIRTHPACFENVQECMREDGEGSKKKKKKFVQLQVPERSQEQHPIPERFPWRQVWQRTMRVRESDEREGERERAGEE